MWHSLPGGAALLGASARLWLSKLRRKSEHCKGMPTSHSICSPGVRFQLAFEFGKQKALRQRGRRNELPLPSASRPSPSFSLVYNFINSLGTGGSPAGMRLPAPQPRVPRLALRAAVFLRDTGALLKHVLPKPRVTAWREEGERDGEKQTIESNFPPKEWYFTTRSTASLKHDSKGTLSCIPSSTARMGTHKIGTRISLCMLPLGVYLR